MMTAILFLQVVVLLAVIFAFYHLYLEIKHYGLYPYFIKWCVVFLSVVIIARVIFKF